MTRRASDTLGPDNVDVDAMRRRGEDQQRQAEAAARQMTADARADQAARREATRGLRGGQD
jgi:hypothetical protein